MTLPENPPAERKEEHRPIEADSPPAGVRRLPLLRTQAGRLCSLVFLLLAVLAYAALVCFSSPPIIAIQIILLGLAIWKRRLPLYVLGMLLLLFGDQPGGRPGEEHFIGSVEMKLYFVDMTLWPLIGLWLLGRIRKGKSPVVASPVTPWLLLFWAASVASLLSYFPEYCAHFAWAGKAVPPEGSVNPFRAVFAVYQVSAFMIYWPMHTLLDLTLSILLFFYLLDVWRDEKARSRLLLCLFAGLMVSMIWGILDSRKILPLDWYRPMRGSPLRYARNVHRLQSFFSHAGWYAQWLALLAPLPLAYALSPGVRGTARRIAALGVYFLACITMILTFQRGGWYALAAATLVICGMMSILYLRFSETRKWGILMITGAGVMILLTGAVLWIGARQEETPLGWRMRDALRYQDRRDIWAAALELHRRYPFQGTGFGLYFVRHELEFPPWHPYHRLDKGEAHNTYLHVLAERGPFALLALIGAAFAALRCFLRAWWRADRPTAREIPWAIAGTAVLAGSAVYGIVQYIFFIRVVDITFYILLAFGILGAQRPPKHETDL